MRKKLFTVAMESIGFQNGILFKEMTDAIHDMRQENSKDLYDPTNRNLKDLAEIVKRHTNISVVFVPGDMHFCVYLPDVNRNHAMLDAPRREWFRSKQALDMIKSAEGGVIRGGVNLKTAKVSGFFADLPTVIHIYTPEMIAKKLTDAEIAAILLHEVGHLFVLFEFMNRTVTTNQVMAGISRALDGTVGADQREYIITSAKKSLNLSGLNPKELAKTSNKQVIETVILSETVKQCVSELGSDIYDLNNFEQLADEFAARMGAGQELVTGLDKIMKGFGGIDGRTGLVYILAEACKLMLLVVSITALALGVGVGAGLYGIFLWTIAILSDSLMDPTYDRRGLRFTRIRAQLLQELKDQKLEKDRRLQLIESVSAIDTIIDSRKDRQQLSGIIAGFIFKSLRKRMDQEKLQSEIEALANNALWLKSAELQALI